MSLTHHILTVFSDNDSVGIARQRLGQDSLASWRLFCQATLSLELSPWAPGVPAP